MKKCIRSFLFAILILPLCVMAEECETKVIVPIQQYIDTLTFLQISIPDNFHSIKSDTSQIVIYLPNNETPVHFTQKLEVHYYRPLKISANEYVAALKDQIAKKYPDLKIIEEKNEDFKFYKTSSLILSLKQNNQQQTIALQFYSNDADLLGYIYTSTQSLADVKKFIQSHVAIDTNTTGDLATKNDKTGKTERDYIRTALISTTQEELSNVRNLEQQAQHAGNKENELTYHQVGSYLEAKIHCMQASNQEFIFESSCLDAIKSVANQNNFVAQASVARMYENLLDDPKTAIQWYIKILNNPKASDTLKKSVKDEIHRLQGKK